MAHTVSQNSHDGSSDTCILPRLGGPGAGAGADSSAAAVILADKMEMDWSRSKISSQNQIQDAFILHPLLRAIFEGQILCWKFLNGRVPSS